MGRFIEKICQQFSYYKYKIENKGNGKVKGDDSIGTMRDTSPYFLNVRQHFGGKNHEEA